MTIFYLSKKVFISIFVFDNGLLYIDQTSDISTVESECINLNLKIKLKQFAV